jgi:hypothetical protein
MGYAFGANGINIGGIAPKPPTAYGSKYEKVARKGAERRLRRPTARFCKKFLENYQKNANFCNHLLTKIV